jgi:biotin operon repressor
MNMKSEIPVYYDEIKGWIALSNETISAQMMMGLKQYVYKVNSQRLKGLIGDKRKRVENALERLKNEGISILADPKQGINMFQSDQAVTTRSFFQMGGK